MSIGGVLVPRFAGIVGDVATQPEAKHERRS